MLGGAPAVAGVDRVIQRALAKKPRDRHRDAESMARELASVPLATGGESPHVHAMTRLIVLPFRVLRPDPDVDFLAFSLPDAIASTLSGVASLIVRSSAAAARVSSLTDIKAVAAEANVDIVLVGTLLRAGEQLRVSTQLLEAPEGTIIWSQTVQVALGDIFQLQDELAHRIVESLSLPLTGREHRLLKHDMPASARAYEFYLRGNQASYLAIGLGASNGRSRGISTCNA